uniref:Uncharacterized protein n=1 Tax=viral metagenome TaxID=1070528 RepID=A0A6C0BF20_9ZZZZ
MSIKYCTYDTNNFQILIGTSNQYLEVIISLDEARYILQLVKELYENYQLNVFSDDHYLIFSGVGFVFSHRVHKFICKNPHHNSIEEEKECIEEIRDVLDSSINEFTQELVSIFKEILRFLFVEKALLDILVYFYI